MEMHQVRYFLAVARTLNFTKAAEECNVTQPSLSRAIIRLEEELGGELFRRERHLTHLTELGQKMAPVLKQCFESALAAKALAQSHKKVVSPPLRLALSHTIDLSIISTQLIELLRAFPALQLKFFRGAADDVANALKTGEFEVAIAGRFGDAWDRFDRWPLFTESFILAVNKTHSLAMKNVVEFSQLRDQRLLPRLYCEAAAELSELLAANSVSENTGDRIVSDHDLVAILEANLGVAIMPESVPRSEKLSRIAIAGLDLRRTAYVYAVAGRERSPSATALIKLLRAADWPRLMMSAAAAA
jgi:DNA-binding transcriptional LysR family regulator